MTLTSGTAVEAYSLQEMSMGSAELLMSISCPLQSHLHYLAYCSTDPLGFTISTHSASPMNNTAALTEAEKACTLPAFFFETKPIYGDLTTHKLMTAIGAVCAIITLLFSLISIFRHLLTYTKPREQRQIIRILLTPLMFTIFNFFSLWFYRQAPYLEPVAQLYECFALVAVFLLFIAYVCPDEAQVDTYFANLERRHRRKNSKKASHGSLRWFYALWIMVFQILFTRLLCTIASWILHAVLCPLDSSLKNAGIAIEAIEGGFTAVCVYAVLSFYGRLSAELKPRHALSKLVCFKFVVLIQIVQGPLLSGLMAAGVLKQTEYISYEDWMTGLPAVLTVVEMLIFSAIFLIPFSAKEYAPARLDLEMQFGKGRKLGFFPALLDALNIADVIMGALFFKQVVGLFKKDPAMDGEGQDLTLLGTTGYKVVSHEDDDDASGHRSPDLQTQEPARQWP